MEENLGKNTVRFSILDRANQISKAKSVEFDLVIIGGGVTGAGIALDASSRGLNVCLIEKNDFASGTSNKSTKLIHGGLRYLKQFEVGLVRESGSERAIVHDLAPHLVVPEKMLLPLIKGGTYGKWMTSIGLFVYDFLANVTGRDRRRMLNKKQTLIKEPLLNEQSVLGSGYYAEYRTDDGRLTLEILKKANEFGATIINYCEMKSFDYDENSKISGLQCKDYNTGTTFQIKAKTYVSATGPWVDMVRKKDNSINDKYLHLTKGIHIVFPHEKLPIKQSLYFDVNDGRMIFAIPRGRTTYVGTTDTNYYGSLDRVVATKADAHYLLNALNHTFQSVNLTIEDIESNWTGLRPLIHEIDKDPSELSRKDELFISNSGLISIAGGKLTGYRKMADRVINAVLKQVSPDLKRKLKRSRTKKIFLVTPLIKTDKEVQLYQERLKNRLESYGNTDSHYAAYLCNTYGRNSDLILDHSSTFKKGTVEEKLIRSELWYCLNYEMTNSLADFFVRRTARLYFNIGSISKHLEVVLKDCKTFLSWDDKKVLDERKLMNELVQDATNYYDQEFERL